MSIRKYRNGLAIAFVVSVAGVFMLAAPANADFYKFTFGGEIFYVSGVVSEPWDGVGIGSVYEVSYIFDSEAEDHSGSAYTGFYYIVSAEIEIDGIVQATTIGDILVSVDEQLYDVHFVDLPIGATAAVTLWASYGTFDTDELPLTLDLDDFPSRSFSAHSYGGQEWGIVGSVDTFSSEIVPAPASVLIIAGGLIFHHRRHRGRN